MLTIRNDDRTRRKAASFSGQCRWFRYDDHARWNLLWRCGVLVARASCPGAACGGGLCFSLLFPLGGPAPPDLDLPARVSLARLARSRGPRGRSAGGQGRRAHGDCTGLSVCCAGVAAGWSAAHQCRGERGAALRCALSRPCAALEEAAACVSCVVHVACRVTDAVILPVPSAYRRPSSQLGHISDDAIERRSAVRIGGTCSPLLAF